MDKDDRDLLSVVAHLADGSEVSHLPEEMDAVFSASQKGKDPLFPIEKGPFFLGLRGQPEL